MGDRDNHELMPADSEREDHFIRELLARHGEPQALAPPTTLAAQVLAKLPPLPPLAAAAAAQRRWRRGRFVALGGVMLLMMLLAVGAWGVLGNSNGPAALFGGAAGGVGRIILVLTLAVKPLIGLLVAPGAFAVSLSALLLITASWVWWWLLQRPIAPVLAESIP